MILNRLRTAFARAKKLEPTTDSKARSVVPVIATPTTASKDKYRKFHKTGPELLLTRILMVNGALNAKEIWRSYERIVK